MLIPAARVVARTAILLTCVVGLTRVSAQDEKLTKFDRDRAIDMLRTIKSDVKKNYYDTKFHGLDVEARFHEAEQKISSAPSMNYALADIAGALDALNDSHTFFLPPPRPYTHTYGWRMEAIGETGCFVTAVKPGSDASSKGVKVGDEVMEINGHPTAREYLWKMQYLYDVLRPQPGLRVVFRSPDGTTRQVDTMAKMTSKKRLVDFTDIFDFIRQEENAEWLTRARYVELPSGVTVWKLPDFDFSPDHADNILGKMHSNEALILDLRGNPGGRVDALERFIGGLIDHEIKIADRVGRKSLKPQMAKPHGKVFSGKLIVLVDSQSASAAEIFARVMQLEDRGKVVGDRSSGSVMESLGYQHEAGADIVAEYGASITEADVFMKDGKSLEKVGVTPDVLVLPTGADLAAGRDPAMARALELAGVKMSPEQAGKFFPPEWAPQ
jgi:C-terminal processing protease CtpA/Prc